MTLRTLPLLALLTACCAEAPLPPPASSPPPAASHPGQPAPMPPPAPPPDRQLEREPPVAARLQLTPGQAQVRLGERAQLALANVDDHAARYYHPEGSNGCQGFSWHVVLVDAQGKSYGSRYEGPGHLCAAVMMPARWVVIEPGQSAPITIETGTVWYPQDPSSLQQPQARELSPGNYEVVVHTPWGAVRGKLSIQPKQASGMPHPYQR